MAFSWALPYSRMSLECVSMYYRCYCYFDVSARRKSVGSSDHPFDSLLLPPNSSLSSPPLRTTNLHLNRRCTNMSLFPSPTPAPSAKSLAATALRSAGLIDKDAQMRDASENPGGRKGKTRSGRTRLPEAAKDKLMGTRMVIILLIFLTTR